MGRRRYFIISELDPEKVVESTMGRVVGEVFYPFSYWAPDGLGLSDDEEDYKRRNTQDIISNILPKPCISMGRKDFLQSEMQPKIFNALVRFLNSDLQTDDVHIPLTKFFSSNHKYAESETGNAQDELYAKDLRELLNEGPDKKGYMVVGFVTAEGVRWRDEAKNSGGEEIFAIAYMKVQFKKLENTDSDVAVGESGDSDGNSLIQQGQLEQGVQISDVDIVDEYRSWEMSESEDGEQGDN